MTTWILILTMHYYQKIGSVSSVNGFANESSCIHAGVLWKNMNVHDPQQYRDYLCVPSNKK